MIQVLMLHQMEEDILRPTEHSKNWHSLPGTKKNKTTSEKLFIYKSNYVNNQCTITSNSDN